VIVTVDAGAAIAARDALAAAGVDADRLTAATARGWTRLVVRVPGAADAPALVRRVLDRVDALGDDVRTVYAPR